MPYDHSGLQNRIRASANLKLLKDRVADAPAPTMTDVSPDFQAGAPYFVLANAAGVHVYPEGEGWIADIVFENVPPGIGNVLGSAVPTASRQQAMDDALVLLRMCVARENEAKREHGIEIIYFDFDGVSIPVSPLLVGTYRERALKKGDTIESVKEWLAEVRYHICGDRPLSPEDWPLLDEEFRKDLVVASTVAMSLGMRKFDMDDAVLSPGPRH